MEKIVALLRTITILGKDWGNKVYNNTNLEQELHELEKEITRTRKD